jgi:hypothetical protein
MLIFYVNFNFMQHMSLIFTYIYVISKNDNTGLTVSDVCLVSVNNLCVFYIVKKSKLKDDITDNTMHFEKEFTETELH